MHISASSKDILVERDNRHVLQLLDQVLVYQEPGCGAANPAQLRLFLTCRPR